jgi:hypothetical protein
MVVSAPVRRRKRTMVALTCRTMHAPPNELRGGLAAGELITIGSLALRYGVI